MNDTQNTPKVVKSDEEWREILSPDQYRILRQSGTERPFTGPFLDNHKPGLYSCAGCGQELFRSNAKFDSHCGWPSFFEPASSEAMVELRDTSHGMIRTEIRCSGCDGHLGHVFPDGPRPTGMRYCINGHALTFDQDG
ncbi:peptide-methionine (R)-S-oxide reductase MsrB [Stappia sp. GBMRC 2046]|uniref:Peptide methionine sulfoxide reductase MsrB n=1 Tax=Stappia sediminis TaxID=2692190 RepID=A0A7X3S8F7_9HYPH|nr:peptide-methionine (R)-S-oxide reductase MsrB [Stappia sediminis]MXN65744.1 peptide-methionine (R)-S-oxide reductase MsrB [Stappia sediminis]